MSGKVILGSRFVDDAEDDDDEVMEGIEGREQEVNMIVSKEFRP